jgi:hypothetical protein
MNEFIEISEEEWFDTYKPIKNPFDIDASFDGHMYETYGDEVNFVKDQDPNKIWMYGQGDDGGTYIWSGWGFVNRLGYFITQVPFPPDTDMQIQISYPDLTCDDCDDIIYEEEVHLCEEQK